MRSFRKLFIVSSLLFFFGVAAMIFFSGGILDKSQEINNNWLPSVIHVSNINTLTSDFRINELQHILSLTEDQMSSYENEMNKKLHLINGELSQYEPLITTETERRLYSDFTVKWKEYLTQNRLMIGLSRENRNEEATALIRARSEALFNDYSHALSALVNENRLSAQKESDTGSKLFLLSLLNLIFVVCVAAVFIYKSSQKMKALVEKIINSCVRIMAERSV